MRRLLSKIVMSTLLACFMFTLASCGGSQQPMTAADGLNLHAVATLVKQARDGEHFENLLNASGINNLDLDGDGNIDYINVKEYGDGDFRGFSLSTALSDGSIQQISEVQFQRGLNGISLQIHGNPQIYGQNYYIRPHQPISVGQVMFLHWLYSPRVVYVSRYSRLYLPPAYVPTRVVSVTTYRTVTTKTVQTSDMKIQQAQKPTITATVKSPNEGKSSPAIVAPLKAPTAVQKEFQARPETKEIQKATGFTKPQVGTPGAVPSTPLPKQNVTVPPAATQPPSAHGTQPVAPHSTINKEFIGRDAEKSMAPATGFAPKPSTVPQVPHTQEKTPPSIASPIKPTHSAPPPVSLAPPKIAPAPSRPAAPSVPSSAPAARPSTPSPSTPSRSK